jgi:hypothetical protein
MEMHLFANMYILVILLAVLKILIYEADAAVYVPFKMPSHIEMHLEPALSQI